jgi:non-canonical purine NTP pyrophosphatase, rdgB/HAM1 family
MSKEETPAVLTLPLGTQVVMATGNNHKVREVEAILRPLVPALQEGGIVPAGQLGASEPVEDGTSFSANALIKARHLAKMVDVPVLADDSGLSVEIMGGAPGIFSARWCGKHGDDKANLKLLLNQLCDVPDQHRAATFICAAALIVPGGGTYLGNGIMGGRLIREARGKAGFGYDPIFVPDGFDVTTAELSAEEKNAISHRHKAFQQIAAQLQAILQIREAQYHS